MWLPYLRPRTLQWPLGLLKAQGFSEPPGVLANELPVSSTFYIEKAPVEIRCFIRIGPSEANTMFQASWDWVPLVKGVGPTVPS